MTQSGIPDNFSSLWQRLLTQWTDSEQVWNDPVRQEFDKRYMTPLQQETMATMREMAKLMDVIAKAQRSVR